MTSLEACPIKVVIQGENFDVAAEISALTQQNKNIGAVVSFVGLCRDEEERLSALELEHYPGMAEDEITAISKQACSRWNLNAATVIHRFGKILPGANIVLVVVAARHRQAAFESGNFIMDFLKTRAPFWKKEWLADGTTGNWVSAKEEDDEALLRWKE